MEKIEFPEGFKEALVQLCDSYDAKFGVFLKSPYEGKAIVDYHYYEIQGEET